jgi:hypothetical protein
LKSSFGAEARFGAAHVALFDHRWTLIATAVAAMLAL